MSDHIEPVDLSQAGYAWGDLYRPTADGLCLMDGMLVVYGGPRFDPKDGTPECMAFRYGLHVDWRPERRRSGHYLIRVFSGGNFYNRVAECETRDPWLAARFIEACVARWSRPEDMSVYERGPHVPAASPPETSP